MVIPSDAGVAGKPGIRIIFPKIGIINCAPAAISIYLTVTVKPSGLPINCSLSEKDF